MACPSSNSIQPSSYAGYAAIHALLAPSKRASNATRSPHCRSFSFRKCRQTLESLQRVECFRNRIESATDSTLSYLVAHNVEEEGPLKFKRKPEAIRASQVTSRENARAGKRVGGRRKTLLEAGSLIEKLDAEVTPLQESGSDSAETQAEVRSRIAEAESTGKLDLSGLRLLELPPEVFDLTGLTELSLAGNRLTQLDPAIGRLSNLSKLGLAGNKLQQLPAEIGTLRYLKGLWVHGNVLESLPPEIGQLRYLGILALGGNRLSTLPETIGCLTSLQSLSIPGNRLTSLEALACGRTLPELKALGLFGNCLTAVPEGVLARLPGLTELWLQGNALTHLPESASDWAPLKSLKQLSLADNDLVSLPAALASLPNLKDLWVYGNRLQSLPLTLVEMPKLAHLWLEGNPLDPDSFGEALSRLPATKKWARKMVVGIDAEQQRGLSAETWDSTAVRKCVKVSSIVGRSGTTGKREGYFKLDHGVKMVLWKKQETGRSETEDRKVDGETADGVAKSRHSQRNGANSGLGDLSKSGGVGEERGDALIFSYMSLVSGNSLQASESEEPSSASPRVGPPSNGSLSKESLEDSHRLGADDSKSEDASSLRAGGSCKEEEGKSGGSSRERHWGDHCPREGLVVVAFGSAPGVPNWAGVLKRVKAALNPEAAKKKGPSKAAGLSSESTTFDVLYVVDARRSWYTQVGSPRGAASLGMSETGGRMHGGSCPLEDESAASAGEGASVSEADDLQLEGDFRIGSSGQVSERDGPDSPLQKVRSKVASRSTLLDAEDLGIARVSTRDPLHADESGRQPGAALGRAETRKFLASFESGGKEVTNGNGASTSERAVSAGAFLESSSEQGVELNGNGSTGVKRNGAESDGSERNGNGRRLSGYYRAELAAAVGGYERVLLLGDSMGASASLLFSTLATRVLSFCPQVDLSTASIRCAEDDAWFRAFRDEVLDDVSRSSAVITVHCGCWLHDLEQAALLPEGKVTVVEHPVEDHRLAKELDYQGKLLPILRTAIEEELLLLTSQAGAS